MTFGGYEVNLRKVDNDILIQCKNVIGKYSQYLNYKKKLGSEFGLKEEEKCKIEFSITYSNGIKIGCLEGSKEELKELINNCELLLKQN